MSEKSLRAFALFETVVKRLNGLFAIVACILVMFMVAVIILAIVTRELGISLIWANDVAQIAFVYVVFLSFGPALATRHHVTVELFEPLVPAPLRRHLEKVAATACILFGAVFLYQLWNLTSRAFADDRMAVLAIPVELKWIQIAGPIGVAMFCLTAIQQLLSSLLRGEEGRETSGGHA
ncbi:TRAP transporter small permease [Neorhizobium petrolearium]|uniref:TRAP transporter small permease n=1 Tax=Neorhizobium petrolearium TaxID=515361 RepID=UPI003F138906